MQLARLVFVTSAALVAFQVNAAVVESETRHTFAGGEGHTLDLKNLAGSITLVGSSGSDIEIIARVVAEHDDAAKADALAAMVSMDIDEDSKRVDFKVLYPVDEYTRYVYKQKGHSFDTRTRYQGKKIKVSSRGRRGSVKLHADFEISVPEGTRLRIDNHFGYVTGERLVGDITINTQTAIVELGNSEGYARLDTGSGSVTVTGHKGEIKADTGSGPVTIRDVLGDVLADTGSGSVVITAVTGNIEADTGSGSVEITDVVGDTISVDTGSGSVSLKHVKGSLKADTGSGGVIATDFTAGDRIDVDTGSGHIRLDGDLSEVRRMRLSAGGGGVTLRMTETPSMMLSIDTGSGSIDLNVPDLRTTQNKRGYVKAQLGDGEGRGHIDTGSGSVRVLVK